MDRPDVRLLFSDVRRHRHPAPSGSRPGAEPQRQAAFVRTHPEAARCAGLI